MSVKTFSLFAEKFECLSVPVSMQTDTSFLKRIEDDPISSMFILPKLPQTPAQVCQFFAREYFALTNMACPKKKIYQLRFAKLLLKEYGFDRTIRAIVFMLRNNQRYHIKSLFSVYSQMPTFIQTYFPEDDTDPREQSGHQQRSVEKTVGLI